MRTFTPKDYQSQVLKSIETNFRTCHEEPSASVAFYKTTEKLWQQGLAYNPLSGFPSDMPYFFLQKADGRFYPDFLCLLTDGVVLVVEYKGADRWAGAKDDRLIGGVWAELSNGTCRFVMVKNREWYQVENRI